MSSDNHDAYSDMRPSPTAPAVVGYRCNGRNDPCACGSGLKQKKCHSQGAPVYGPEPAAPPKQTKKVGIDARMAVLPILMLGGGLR